MKDKIQTPEKTRVRWNMTQRQDHRDKETQNPHVGRCCQPVSTAAAGTLNALQRSQALLAKHTLSTYCMLHTDVFLCVGNCTPGAGRALEGRDSGSVSDSSWLCV